MGISHDNRISDARNRRVRILPPSRKESCLPPQKESPSPQRSEHSSISEGDRKRIPVGESSWKSHPFTTLRLCAGIALSRVAIVGSESIVLATSLYYLTAAHGPTLAAAVFTASLPFAFHVLSSIWKFEIASKGEVDRDYGGGVVDSAALDKARFIVVDLCRAHRISLPQVICTPIAEENAWFMQRLFRPSILGISPKLLKEYSHEELKAVIAHELSHESKFRRLYTIAFNTLGYAGEVYKFISLAVFGMNLSSGLPLVVQYLGIGLGIWGLSLIYDKCESFLSDLESRCHESLVDLKGVLLTGNLQAAVATMDRYSLNRHILTGVAREDNDHRVDWRDTHPHPNVRAERLKRWFAK